LFRKPKIEVRAFLPEASAAAPDALADLKQELADPRQSLEAGFGRADFQNTFDGAHAGDWKVGRFLERSGLLPVYAQEITEELIVSNGPVAPEPLRQIELAAEALKRRWRPADPRSQSNAHVLVGAPGVGKTTCLCKWLAQSVLAKGEAARVWRLDGRAANTAEMLAIYAEVLHVPLERIQPASYTSSDETLFIDLPGVLWTDTEAVRGLGEQLNRFPPAGVHLVLNAAYESGIILAQISAFSSLPISSLIFTHLDEETQWGKLWNVLLGTNYSIGYFSAGQNIPGKFFPACPETLVNLQFARKSPEFISS
jgi:flagellar biosynthesis GTPase FlhF